MLTIVCWNRSALRLSTASPPRIHLHSTLFRTATPPPQTVPPARALSMSTSTAPYALERAIAIDAVLRASRLATKVYETHIAPTLSASQSSSGADAKSTITKVDKSPVTIGDYAAQAVVNTLLGLHFPSDGIVGEEEAAELREEKNAKLKQHVCDLAREALHGSSRLSAQEKQAAQEADKSADDKCPAIGNAKEEEEYTDEKLLQALDRGNSNGGSSGRECGSQRD